MNLEWANSPVWLAINALVAYRLTRLWLADMLPPIPRIRRAVENYAVRTSRLYKGPTQERAALQNIYGDQPSLSYLVTCAGCSGFWISAAVVVAASLIPATAWALIALPFALSAVVGLLDAKTD